MSSVLDLLWEVFFQSTLLIAAVIGIRLFLKGRISPVVSYACWSIVLLRLVFPVSIKSVFSFMNVIQPVTQQLRTAVMKITPITPAPNGPVPSPAAGFTPDIVSGSPAGTVQTASVTAEPATVLLLVWLAGVVLTLAYILYVNIKFYKHVNKHRSLTRIPLDLMHLFDCCKIKRGLPVFCCEGISAPCLAGLFRPMILVNRSTLEDTDILRYVLIHEICHYKHKDHIWALARNLVLAAYWFHPLVWISARLSKKDCEQACDAAVMDIIQDNERTAYGKALISLVSNKAACLADTTTTMGGGKNEIKERLKMIVKRPKMLRITVLCLAVLMSILVAAACTGGIASNDGNPVRISEKPSGPPLPSQTEELHNTANTGRPETIYGVAPVDLVDNDLSRGYFPALVKAYKASLKDPDRTTGNKDYPFKLFAIEPFEKGALMLAGHAISQEHPELYYMEGDRLISFTSEAEFFSLNYTIYKNHTISYGLMLDEGKVSVKASGAFANGEKIERAAKPVGNYDRGYILIAKGQTWPLSIKFFDQNGGFVTDENSEDLGWNQSYYHWKKSPAKIWNVLQYTQMLEKPIYRYDKYNLAYGDNNTLVMNCFVDDGSFGIQYIWRSHNNLAYEITLKPSELITTDKLPQNAAIYWVNIEKDDGSDKNIPDLLVEGSLQAPEKNGSYCFIVKTDNLIYSAFIVVSNKISE